MDPALLPRSRRGLPWASRCDRLEAAKNVRPHHLMHQLQERLEAIDDED